MFSGKPKKDIDSIVYGLALSGANVRDKSMFLGRREASDRVILDFLSRYEVSRKVFLIFEDILRFAVAYNVISRFLELEDEDLENQILKRLRNPDVFLETYRFNKIFSQEKVAVWKDLIEAAYSLLIDDLGLPEKGEAAKVTIIMAQVFWRKSLCIF